MLEIKYSVLSFSIELQVDCRIPQNKTSALRGILGQSLGISNCFYDLKQRDCNNCFLHEKCLGNSILNAKLKKKPYFLAEDNIPPIIIECDDYKEEYLSGDRINFTFIILGDTISYIPYIIKAYELAGIMLGLQGNLFNIHNVRNEFGEVLYNGEYLNKDKIIISDLKEYVQARKRLLRGIRGIEIITPLRFKQNGRYSDDINEKNLLDLILRRIITVACLQYEVEEVPKMESDYKFSSKKLQWKENDRYSNRQEQKMSMGGIVGRIEFEWFEEEIIDYLIACELIHIGKSTVFGLGQYRIY